MKKKLYESLKIITKALNKMNIKWCIIGSLSLYLQGVKIKPKDIDLLTDKEGAYEINKVLKKFEIKPVEFSRSDIFSSYYGKFLINGIKFEVMGDLNILLNARWNDEVMKRLYNKKEIKYNDILIPVSPLEDQLKSYKKLNRKKDSKKVQKIKAILKKEK